jgi:hypothetical protein
MKQHRVGFKWKDGSEYYVTMKCTGTATEISKELMSKDKTGNLVAVYVKPVQ